MNIDNSYKKNIILNSLAEQVAAFIPDNPFNKVLTDSNLPAKYKLVCLLNVINSHSIIVESEFREDEKLSLLAKKEVFNINETQSVEILKVNSSALQKIIYAVNNSEEMQTNNSQLMQTNNSEVMQIKKLDFVIKAEGQLNNIPTCTVS